MFLSKPRGKLHRQEVIEMNYVANLVRPRSEADISLYFCPSTS